MNTKLNCVENWPELAKQANWTVGKLAKQCKVSPRTLERFFLKNMVKSPKTWLLEQRQQQAGNLLHNGYSVKELASILGYKYPSHFSLEFKRY
ncbi:MAG TPA: helix-turn-helix transcriptional regulator [Candidatus Acidoferrum sp.]|nr:helix-turn-helix transcriptional regulator [Candidatus Acidoferrum sp.]